MKKLILLYIFFIVYCVSFAQQVESTTKVPTSTEQIKSLQSENIKLKDELTKVQQDLTYTAKRNEVLTQHYDSLQIILRNEIYNLKSDETNRFNGYISHVAWLIGLFGVLITVIVAIVGFLVPYMYNRSLRKQMEKRKAESKEMKKKNTEIEYTQTKILNKANEFESQIKKMKEIESEVIKINKYVTSEKNKAEKAARDAEEASIKAEVNKLFAEAFNEKDFEKQIKLYDKVIELDPNNYNAYNNRGAAKAELTKYEEAILDYDKVIELDPNNSNAYNNRGYAKIFIEKYHEALEDINKSLSLNNDNANTLDSRAVCYRFMELFEEAIEDHKRAISIAQFNPALYEERAKTYRAMTEDERYTNRKNELIALATADEATADKLKLKGQ